jgi:hypothetical protein
MRPQGNERIKNVRCNSNVGHDPSSMAGYTQQRLADAFC